VALFPAFQYFLVHLYRNLHASRCALMRQPTPELRYPFDAVVSIGRRDKDVGVEKVQHYWPPRAGTSPASRGSTFLVRTPSNRPAFVYVRAPSFKERPAKSRRARPIRCRLTT